MDDITVFGTDGNLNPDLLKPIAQGGYGFYDVGNITENGVEFNPQFNVDEVMVWQSRKSQRSDITKDEEEVAFSMADSTPLVDYLWHNLPIGTAGTGAVPSLGSSGYSVSKPFYSDIVYRQLLIIGVDGSVGPNGQPEYVVELRPRVSMCKKSKKQWAAKQVDVTELTWCCYVDPASGYDIKQLRGGTVWLDEGGPVTFATSQVAPVATATTTGKATITLAQPVSPNQPFTYAVQKSTDAGTTWTSATLDTAGNPPNGYSTDGDGNVTIKVSGLTSGATVFKVVVTAANGTTGTSLVSNSATIT